MECIHIWAFKQSQCDRVTENPDLLPLGFPAPKKDYYINNLKLQGQIRIFVAYDPLFSSCWTTTLSEPGRTYMMTHLAHGDSYLQPPHTWTPQKWVFDRTDHLCYILVSCIFQHHQLTLPNAVCVKSVKRPGTTVIRLQIAGGSRCRRQVECNLLVNPAKRPGTTVIRLRIARGGSSRVECESCNSYLSVKYTFRFFSLNSPRNRVLEVTTIVPSNANPANPIHA
jgi:hypothetical protein